MTHTAKAHDNNLIVSLACGALVIFAAFVANAMRDYSSRIESLEIKVEVLELHIQELDAKLNP